MRIFLTICSIGALLIFVSGFTSSVKSDPIYKNLQVLPKDISKHSLDSTMDAFKHALGVGCKYCHAQDKETHHPAWESDDKPEKTIARKMMLMCNGINKQYFSDSTGTGYKAVTCFTCHHGQPIPGMDTVEVRK
jgi:hypothetical protein